MKRLRQSLNYVFERILDIAFFPTTFKRMFLLSVMWAKRKLVHLSDSQESH
jgi:hypothetical protein